MRRPQRHPPYGPISLLGWNLPVFHRFRGLVVGQASAQKRFFPFKQLDKLNHRPNPVRDTSHDRRGCLDRLVLSDEVVVKVMQRDRVLMIFDFLGKAVAQPSESTHLHTHGQVLSFDERRVDMLRFRCSAFNNRVSAGANGRAVTGLSGAIVFVFLNQGDYIFD